MTGWTEAQADALLILAVRVAHDMRDDPQAIPAYLAPLSREELAGLVCVTASLVRIDLPLLRWWRAVAGVDSPEAIARRRAVLLGKDVAA